MLLTENFVEVLAEANKLSRNIAGQIFTYNTKRQMFEVLNAKRSSNEFKNRSVFLLFNTVALLLRILTRKHITRKHTGLIDAQTEVNLCVMMMFACILPMGRYHVRGKCSSNFTTFFNQIIQVEKRFIRGKKCTIYLFLQK